MAAVNPPRFSVIVLPPVLAQFRTWAEQSARSGRRQEYLDALRLTLRRLDYIPVEWGDPLRGYDHITALEYRGMITGWWLVWYGVDVAARQVFVRTLLPAPGSPLAAGE